MSNTDTEVVATLIDLPPAFGLGDCHYGFWLATTPNLALPQANLYNLIRSHVVDARKEGKKVWLTGHSLGGAVANITASRLMTQDNIDIQGMVTFGTPEPGDAHIRGWDFAQYLDLLLDDRHQRIVVEGDPVPIAMRSINPGPFGQPGVVRTLRESDSSDGAEGTFFAEAKEIPYDLVWNNSRDHHTRYWDYLTTLWFESDEIDGLNVDGWPHINLD